MSEDPTQITQRTILEAINAIGVELHQFRAETNKRFEAIEARLDKIQAEVSELRQEMNDRFEAVESSINVLSGDVTRLRALSPILTARSKRPGDFAKAVEAGRKAYEEEKRRTEYPPGEPEGESKRS